MVVWLRRILIGLVAVVAVLGLTLWAVLGTAAGTRWVVAQGLGAAGGTVRLERVEGTLLDRLTLHGVEVADGDGVWLTADRLAIDWAPGRLLAGRLWINHVAARDVAVLRPPAAAPEDPAAEEAAPFDPAQLERLTVRALDLDGLRLAEPVLGTAMAFRAKGDVTGTQREGIHATLRAERLDAPGEATLDAVHRPGGVLEIHLAAYEPPGGAVARLLALPGLPAVRLTLDGEGPAARWSGALLAEARDFVSIEADVALSLDDAGQSLAVTGAARPGPLMPVAITAATGEALGFAATLSHAAADGTLAAREVRLDGQGWSLTGSGHLHPADGAQARAVLEIADGAALESVAGVPVGQGRLDIAAQGPLDALEVDAQASLSETVVRRAEVRARAVVGGDSIPFSLQGSVGGVEEVVPQAAPVVGERLDFAAAGSAAVAEAEIAFTRLTVQSPVLGAEYAGVVGLAPLTIAGGLEASLTDLAALEPLTGLPLRGVATLGADLRADQEAIAGDLRVSLRDFATGIPQADALAGGQVDLGASVQWRGTTLRLEEVRLRAPGATLDGAVALENFSGLAGRFVAEVPRLDRLGLGVDGAVRAEGTVNGTVAAPVIAATVGGRDVVAAGLAVTQPQARVQVTAQRLAVEDLRAGVAGVRVAGAGTMPFASGLFDGALDLRMESPEAFARLTGQPLTGSLGGRVEFRPRDGGQAVSARLSGDALALPDAGVALSTLTVSADLTDALSAPGGRIEARLGAGGAAGVTWQAATLTAVLEDGGGRFSVRMNDDAVEQPYQAQVDGRLSLGDSLGDATVVRLETVSLDSRGHRVRLTRPATLTVGAGGAVALSEASLAVDGGSLMVRGTLGGGAIDLAAGGRRLPLQILDLAAPTFPVRGTVALDLTLQGPLSRPTGQVRVRTSDLGLPEAGVEGLVIEADADLADNRVAVQVRFAGLTPDPAVIAADLPLVFSETGLPSVPPEQPLTATVDWRGPVQSVWALVPVVGHRLAGEAVVAARLHGTMENPRFSGEATVRDGAYENLDWGTVLRQIRLTAALTPNGDISLDAEATDGGAGRLSIAGAIDNTGFSSAVQASVVLDGVQVARRDDLKAGLSGELTYAGSLDEGALTGDLRTETVRYTIGAALGGGIPDLEVEEVNRAALGEPEETAEAAEAGPPFGSAITLGIRVVMPNRLYVAGQGLESEWKGDLTVGGTLAAPTILGSLTVVRGTFSAINRTFVLETGTVDFSGGEEINPTVTVRAVHEAEEIAAIVAVSGPADDLDFALESRPALPQDEIIARVLFGRGMGELGAAEALAVAQAAAQLAGIGGGGPGILDRLRGSLALDVLNVGGGAGGPTVEAGRYISDNVYVGVERGAGEDSTSVEVEVELAPGVTLETRGSARSGADIGVEWKFDY